MLGAPLSALAIEQTVAPPVTQNMPTVAAAASAASAATAALSVSAAAQQVVVEGRLPDALAQRRLATGVLSVIDRDELDLQGDVSVLDVLQRQLGITLDGEEPQLGGLGQGYTIILINGSPAPPGFRLASLAPADVARIDISKGPSAEFGGTAGVINVILRSTPRLRQRELRLTPGWRSGRPQAAVSFNWGDRNPALAWTLPLSAQRWTSDTAVQVERLGRSPAGGLSRQQQQGTESSSAQSLSFSPRLDANLGPTDTLQLQGFAQQSQLDTDSPRTTQSLEGPQPYSVRDTSHSAQRTQLARVQMQWQHKQADGRRLELRTSAQSLLSRSETLSQGNSPAALPLPQRESRVGQRETTTTVALRARLPLAHSHVLTFGADLEDRQRRELRQRFDDGIESADLGLGQPLRLASRRVSLYAQDDFEAAPGWQASAGVRVIEAALVATGTDGQFRQDAASIQPVLNARIALDPAGRQLLRLGLAGSLRLPDTALLLPRYALNGSYDRNTANTPIAADSAGNPLLMAEHTFGLDISYEQHFGSVGVASVAVFQRQVRGLIRRRIALEDVPQASVPRWVSRPVNLGQARSSGLELAWKGRLRAGLNLRAGWSWYRSTVAEIDDPDARLEGQPPQSAKLGFDHAVRSTPWVWGANLSWVPAYATQQSDLQRQTRNAQRRLDAFVFWRHTQGLELRLSATNLLAADLYTASSVSDLDGFAASAATRRQSAATFNLALTYRF